MKRLMKRTLAMFLSLTMILGMGIVSGVISAPEASAAEATSGIDSYESLVATYGTNTGDDGLVDGFIYIGTEYYEEDGNLTDYYVQPGDKLTVKQYVKSNMYTGENKLWTLYDNTFFDVMVVADGASTATSGYTSNYQQGIVNSDHPMMARNGSINILTSNPLAGTAWVTNYCEFDATYLANNDYVQTTTKSSTSASTIAYQMTSDEWILSYYVTVKEGLADGTKGIADSPVGLYPVSGTNAARRQIYIPCTHITAGSDTLTVTGCKTMASQITGGQLDYFLNEDMYHEFTIGEPPAEVKYTATFVVDGVTVSEEEYSEGETIVVPADPEKEGYEFTGWDAVPGVMGTENLVFNATWKELVYIYFMIDGEIYVYLSDDNDLADELAAPDKEGYAFDKWIYEDGTEVVFPVKLTDKSIYVYAKYDVLSYDVTWDVDGETTTETLEYGAEIVAPADPEKEGHTFAGWGADVPATMPAENLTFTAEWDINKHTVTWNVDGETTIDTVEYGAEIVVPADPEKEGHTFAGWDAEIPAAMPDEDLAFTATWDVNEYTVTWDIDGETTTETLEYGAEIVAPADPEKEGHTFVGWGEDVPATMPAENKIFTAEWDINKHTVTWNVDGETTTDTVEYGAEIVVPADPEKEGHTFAGWDAEIPAAMPDEDLTFTATWNVNEYTVTWDVDGVTTEEIYEYGAAIVAPADPEKVGYTFTGWTPEVPVTMPAENKTFTATWDVNEYTVTWVVDDVTTTDTVAYGAEIVAPADPEKEGHTFAGWDAEIPAAMPDEDLTFTATWNVNEYTVTWDVDGVTTEEIYEYGAAIVAPADPEKVGYTFTGWTPEVLDTMPAEDVVYTATWKVNEYTVTWTVDGETTEETYEYGAAIVAPAVAEKVGYTFAGWTPEVLDTMPAEDLAYEATWTKNKYNAVFDANGGQFADGASTATVATEYEAAVVAPEAPEKAGYAFVMWTPELTDSMPAEEVTYTAVWAEGEGVPYIVETYTMDVNGEYGDAEIAYYAAEVGEITITPDTEEGFSVDEELSVLSGVVSDADMLVLKAYIARNKYTATFDANGGSFGESNVVTVEIIYGAEIEAPAAPTMDEYNFEGWNAEIPATMPANNLTFKATWVLSHVHTEGDWEIVKEATVDEEGEAVKKCTSCGEVIETATLSKLPAPPANITTSDGEDFESGSEITYGETVILTVENIPEGATVEWIVEGEGVEISVSEDGKTCEVTSVSSGKATVKAVIVAKDGTETAAEVTINSDACFFQRLLHFFRSIFNCSFFREFFSKIF